jgi:hypothetical protein
MGCLEPDEQSYLKCLPVDKKSEQEIQLPVKKRRKQLEIVEEEIILDATKSNE